MPVITKTASLARNAAGEEVIKISFPYSLNTLFQVRSIPGRRYHESIRCWSAPVYPKVIDSLVEWGFVLDHRLINYMRNISLKKSQIIVNNIKGLNGTPYPFQKEGVAFIDSKNGRALVADEMGLGKTILTIAWLQLHLALRPVIIVVPAALKLNWKKELYKWMPNPDPCIVKGTKPYRTRNDIVIINYDILPYWYKVLRDRNPKVIVTDECHYYKSSKAKRTKAVKMLAKGIPHFIALSGTPIENRPIEIYNAVNIIDPTLFPNRWHFLQHYCNARHTGFGWDFKGASHISELHTILTTTVMIRRKKKDVLKDLPEKVWSFIPIELSNYKEYQEAEMDFINWVKKEKGKEAAERASNAAAISSIEALKQLAVKGKLDQSIDWIEDFLQSDKKLVVFATHHFVIDALIERFNKIAVHIDGRVSMVNRQKAVDQFQNDPTITLFIGNIKAAGVGITLTASSDVAFLELPWTPGELEQASDRVHRIGQKDSVTIHYLLADGTIEERIARLLDYKRKILDAILDGKETEQESLLTELMKGYEK